MGAYLIRRALQAIPVILLSTVMVFTVIHLIPGDPAQVLAGADASASYLASIRHGMGLDQPLPVQYLIWMGHILRGNLGTSTHGQTVAFLLASRVPATLELAATSMVLSLLISIPLGVLAAAVNGTKADWLISTVQSIWLAIPNFFLGILFVILFALILHWLPPGGRTADGQHIAASIKSLILPSVSLALGLSAFLSRFVKFNMLEVLYDDFVRTARAKGLRSRRVIFGHALRNAMLPVITILGLQFAGLLGGQVVIETVFSWPGIGGLLLDAIGTRDYPVVEAGLLFLVLLIIAVNIMVDLTYGFIDPRTRLSEAR
ncbi:MAG: ABC transporter permease [Chloroflexota bacterium]